MAFITIAYYMMILLLGDAGGGGDDDKSEQRGPLDHGPAQKRVHLVNIVTAL